MDNWISVEDKLPKNRKPIIGWDGKCQYIVNYYRAHQEDIDFDDDYDELLHPDIEMDDKTQTFWLRPGFYETEEQQGGYYDEISIKRTITHWQPLPSPPNTTIK